MVQDVSRYLAVAAFLSVVGTLGWFDIVSLDFGWHLAAGRLIAATGSIPTHDVFSYVAEGNPWVDSQWLFQLVLYGSYVLGGVPGVVLLRIPVVLVAFTALLFTIYRKEYFGISLLVCILALFVSFQRFLLRPELFSLCFLALFFYWIEHLPRHPRLSVVTLFLCQIVWNNMHGLHVLGPIFLVLHLGGDLLQAVLCRIAPRFPPVEISSRVWKAKLAAVAATAAALLVNANGLAGILYPYEIFGELTTRPAVFRGLGELQSPFSVNRPFPHPVAVYKLLLGLSLLALVAQLGRIRLAHLLPYAAFLYLSTLALRNMSLFAVVAAPVTIRNLYGVADFVRSRYAGATGWRPWLAAAQGIAIVAFSAWSIHAIAGDALYRSVGLRRSFGAGVGDHFPQAAVAYLRDRDLRGRIFNNPEIGGYLLWQLFPRHQVAFDGRWEVYGDSLKKYPRFTDSTAFARFAVRHRVEAVVLHKQSVSFRAMMPWLRRSSAWQLVKQTRNAVIFERPTGG